MLSLVEIAARYNFTEAVVTINPPGVFEGLLLQRNPLRYAFGVSAPAANSFEMTTDVTQSLHNGILIAQAIPYWFDLPKYGSFVQQQWFWKNGSGMGDVTIFEIVLIQ